MDWRVRQGKRGGEMEERKRRRDILMDNGWVMINYVYILKGFKDQVCHIRRAITDLYSQ
jgi:hypothetical protein